MFDQEGLDFYQTLLWLDRNSFIYTTLNKDSLIVFDIDGTLTDSVNQHQKAFTDTLFEIGVTEVNSNYKSYTHHTDSFIAKEIFETNQHKPFSEKTMQDFEKGLTRRISRLHFNGIKGAQQLLENLQKNTEFGVCFATGSLRHPAEHKLNSIGVEYKNWQLVASDHIYEREGIVKKAIEQARQNYGVMTFNRIISVGDGLWDLRTAQNLKIEFIGVGEKNKELLLQNGARVVFRDLGEFKLN